MAFTVTTDLTTVDDAESTGAWTSGALDPDKFVQNANSIGWYASKNGRRVNGVSSKSISHSAGDHLYFWAACDVASKLEDQTTGTTTASGLTALVTLSGGATREWHVAGANTWDGGWRCFVVDMGHTGTHLYAESGTWSTANNITDIDFYYDLTNSGNIRNVPANTYQDVIRVGTGLTAYNTSAADASFDLADIAAQDEAVANRYGVLETKDGVLFSQGRVTVGDTGTNHTDFDSQDETFVFSLRDGTDGFGLVSDDLYEMNFVGNATGSDQDISFGVKVGTGDTATGRSGTTIQGTGAVRWKMDWNDADIHSFTMYGSVIRGAYDGTGVIGVQAGSPVTTHEVVGSTFDACGQIDFQDAVCRDINVLNSQETGTTFGAILWDETDSDIKYSLCVNNTNAFEVTTLTGHMTFVGMEFSSNTYDVRYEGASDYNLNWSEASGAPSINNAGAGTLTAVNAVDTDIHVYDIETNLDVASARVLVWCDTGGTFPAREGVDITRSGTTATADHTGHGLKTGNKVWIRDQSEDGYEGVYTITVTTVDAYTFTVDGTETSPATATSTLVIIDGTTDVNGDISDSRSYTTSQPILGRARKSSASPYYRTSPFTGTIDSGSGVSIEVGLLSDE